MGDKEFNLQERKLFFFPRATHVADAFAAPWSPLSIKMPLFDKGHYIRAQLFDNVSECSAEFHYWSQHRSWKDSNNSIAVCNDSGVINE